MTLRVRLGICLGHTIAGVSGFVKPQHMGLEVSRGRSHGSKGEYERARTENPSFREAGRHQAAS